VAHDELLGLAKINQVRSAVAVHIHRQQRAQAFVRGQRINAEARVGRQLVQFQFARRLGVRAVRLAG
jgi:hypothetical protein